MNRERAPSSFQHVFNQGKSGGSYITIVYTGYGPLMGHPVNASWEALKQLPNCRVASLLPSNIEGTTEVRVYCYELPVEYQPVTQFTPKIWSCHKPDHEQNDCGTNLVVHLGVSYKAVNMTLEQYARNYGYVHRDVKGNTLSNATCVPGAPPVLQSLLSMDLAAFRVNSRNCGFFAEASYDAGMYLCEYIFCLSLAINNKRTAFFHIPDFDKGWTPAALADAVCVCTSELLRQLQERRLLQNIRQ